MIENIQNTHHIDPSWCSDWKVNKKSMVLNFFFQKQQGIILMEFGQLLKINVFVAALMHFKI
jgi:hypothetical protein